MSSDNITVLLSLSSSPSTPRVPVKLSKTTNVSEFRTIVSNATKIPLSSLKLIYRGRMIKSDNVNVIESYNIEDNCVVHCMGKPVKETNAPVSIETPAPKSAGASFTTVPSSSQSTTTSSGNTSLSGAIALLKSSSDPKTSISTILKIITNVTSHPMEEKYRTIKSSNAAFQKRLGSQPGGHECMLAIGFIKKETGEYTMTPTPEAWSHLVSSKAILERELASLQHQQQPYSPNTPSAPAIPSSLPNMMPNMMDFLSNPDALQNVLRNPMMQQYLTPEQQQVLNNPQMMQRMQSMMNNPQMRQRMQNMMSDPQMMQNMMAMARPGGTPPNFSQMEETLRQFHSNMRPGGSNNPGSSGVQPTTGSNNAGGQQQSQEDESSMTEEEMIAEAIARSLREN